jgi:hypothetical protein
MEHFRFILLQALAAPVAVPNAATTSLVMMIATFISQIKVNGFAAFVIQRLKASEHPALAWISANTPWVTRAIAAIAASLTAIGIHWTFSGSTLIVSGLSVTAIVTGIYNIAQNYLFQHAWYKMVFEAQPSPVRPSAPILPAGFSPTANKAA